MHMATISDLPQIAVEQILRRARGRSIAGSNKYARVCRQWQEAQDEAEPLQLFMDLSLLSEEDLARAASWLCMHGQHVDVLVAHAIIYEQAQNVGWLVDAAPALRNLRRLEVPGIDSLRQLAPVFEQLPQLRHLEAGVRILPHPSPHAVGGTTTAPEQDLGQQVPNMQEMCPHLTSLHLRISPIWNGYEIDGRFSRLFSPGLQQLHLQNVGSGEEVYLCASSVAHMGALQQLTLHGVHLDKQCAHQLAQELGALQQLRVIHPHGYDAGRWAGLATKLTEYAERFGSHVWGPTLYDQGVLANCVHLTRLVLGGDLPEGMPNVLAALTGLRELRLWFDHSEGATAGVVEQVARMAQLRSLQLEGWGGGPKVLGPSLQQCTQLTALVLLVYGSKGSSHGSWVPALQQLTELRRLTAYEDVVMDAQGTWLAPLTQLTRLCVKLSVLAAQPEQGERGRIPFVKEIPAEQRMPGYHAAAQRVIAHIQQWTAALQQVLFCVPRGISPASIVPMCWQLPASGAGRPNVTAWLEERNASAPGWARPLRPCPHLAGVWELQGPAPGRPWDLA
jgi:hypothetical protein